MLHAGKGSVWFFLAGGWNLGNSNDGAWPFLLSLRQRCVLPELMDQPELDAIEHGRALAGLARINALSGSARILWPSLRDLARRKRTDGLRVLDVASGAGDVPIRLWASPAGQVAHSYRRLRPQPHCHRRSQQTRCRSRSGRQVLHARRSDSTAAWRLRCRYLFALFAPPPGRSGNFVLAERGCQGRPAFAHQRSRAKSYGLCAGLVRNEVADTQPGRPCRWTALSSRRLHGRGSTNPGCPGRPARGARELALAFSILAEVGKVNGGGWIVAAAGENQERLAPSIREPRLKLP